ncbi:MAG: extracellular solute-binding protein [Ruminococcaceae bacterium]|nr:extracellular solute-binding protein [Oscillospiraceae bacterium]
MKKIFALLLVLAMVLSMAACAPSTTNPTEGNDNVDLSGTYKITMWVSESEGVADQFKDQIAEFNKTNGQGIVIEAQIEGVSEANAGSQVLADVASAPDIYCFAQDQLARLVQASALLPLGKGAAATITANNDAGSVAAGTVAGTLYAYPMTSDNGYYMYYDKSIISEEEALDLAAIVAKCEANNKKFRFALENGWYVASFFFATGCHTNWTTNENGDFVSVDDTFNSEAGMIAMKGMQILAKSTCYDSNADIFTDAGVVVTGIWNATAAADHFGENLGATKLPSFTVDGKTYQLGSYSGNKLMGVKPQTDGKRGAVLSLLAQYLTNEECQSQRYASFQWGPSNLKAQASEAVQANLSLAALAAQNAFATPQGQIAGVYWDNSSALGAVAKNAADDAALQAGLDNYKAAIDAYLSLTPEQRRAFTVIGGIKNTGWGTDFEMKEDPAGTWTSVEAFELTAGTEFKVRQGMDWKVAFGDNTANADKSIPLSDKPNYKVEADGKYYIRLVLGENNETAEIILVPAE